MFQKVSSKNKMASILDAILFIKVQVPFNNGLDYSYNFSRTISTPPFHFQI